MNGEYTFTRCNKYSSKLDISRSFIRIFALDYKIDLLQSINEWQKETNDTMMDKGIKTTGSKEQIVKSTSEEHNDAIALMRGFMDSGNPKVGIFWYDYINNILFGVEKGDVELYMTQGNMVTYPKLHKTYWQKQHHRAVAKNDTNSIFYREHNYTQIPRGRIFYENGTFYVNVGSWINGTIDGVQCIDSSKLRELIIDEFDLPEDFIFRQDIHWDIGHGWSEERF